MNTDIKMAGEEIAQDIQENLERAKQELFDVSENLMRDIELRAFADIYAISVPSKKREESAKAVRELRDREWKEALKKAKGDELKAARIWAKLD